MTPPAVPAPRFHHVWGGISQRVFVLNAQRAWTGEEGGRIRSTVDGGATWQFQPTPNEINGYIRAVHFLTRGPLAGVRGWAAGSNGRLLATTDSGINWAVVGPPIVYPAGDPMAGQPVDVFDVVFLDALNGWLGGIRALRRTTDGGQTWIDLLPLNPHIDPHELEVYRLAFLGPGGGLPAVAAAEPGLMLRSTDGTSWTKTLDGATVCPALPSGLELWDVQFLAGQAPDTAIGFAVGGQGNQCGGFFSTTDGGSSWTEEHALALPSTLYGVTPIAGTGALACGYGGRAFARQSAADPEWVDISARLEPPKVNVRIPLWGAGSDGAQTAWIVGLMNHVYKTGDAGESWTKQRGFGVWRMRDIHYLDENRGWATTQNITVLRTQDGGATWIEELRATNGPNLNVVRLRDGTRGFAGGDSIPGIGPLLFYYDPSLAPNSWHEVAIAPPPAPPAPGVQLWSGTWVVRAGVQDAWVVGTRGTVLRSTDGEARTWSYFPGPPSPDDVELFSIGFDGADALYCSGVRRSTGTPVAYRLRYPALAWEDLSPSGVFGVWRAIVAQGAIVYAVGTQSPTEGAIYQLDSTSPPGAAEWVKLVPAGSDPAPQALHCAALVGQGANRVLFAGGARGMVLRLQGGAWTTPKSQTCVTLTGMSFLSPSRGWATGHGSLDGTGVGSSDGLGDSALVGYR